MKNLPDPKKKLGLVHFYYGMGCGKTSIALGHIIRLLGRNLKPILVQFLKKHDPTNKKGFFYGEYITLKENLNVPILQYGCFKFVKTDKDKLKLQRIVDEGLQKVKQILSSNEYDLVILDEIGSIIKTGLTNAKSVVEIIENRAPNIEIIMTGHEFISEFSEISDYITHLEEIKHPFQNGIVARPGIEF